MRSLTDQTRKFYIAILILISSDVAFANRLEAAAQRSSQTLLTIGQATAVIGVVLGGIALSLGASQMGRMLLTSGILGAVCVFGGPAIIDVLRSLF